MVRQSSCLPERTPVRFYQKGTAMKLILASGVSARVKRWFYLMYVVTVAGLLTIVTQQPASAANCIKTNNLFSGPLDGPLGQLEGAFGGIMMPIVYFVLALLGVWGVITVARNKDASGTLKGMVAVASIPFGLIALLLLVRNLFAALNNSC